MPDIEMELHDSLDNAIRGAIELRAEIERLRAEIERLRAALQEIADRAGSDRGAIWCRERAIAALQGSAKPA